MIDRQTIIFLLPLEMEAIVGSSNPLSSSGEDGIPSNAGDAGASWDRRQLYINPQSFQIRDQKLIQKNLTKGGHVVQYWGEDLTTIDVQGTTGSSGIEGINVLKDIYRHEQIHYRTVLADRQREIAAAAAAAQSAAEEQVYDSSFGGFMLGAADALTGGAVSKTVDGVSNTIDILLGTSLGNDFGGTGGTFKAVPTLAAFAVNVDMYYQGEFFRGYFGTFNTTESATEPGHFSYNFQFVVTRRTGKRTNFMPWHRNPVSFDGETVKSQTRTESKGSFPGLDMLSFPADKDKWAVYAGNYSSDTDDSNEFVEAESDVEEAPEPNQVPIDRRKP